MKKGLVGAMLLAGAMAVTAAPGVAQMANNAPAAPRAATWQIDTSHSELSFRIRHLVSRVRGTFDSWSGTIVADPANLTNGSSVQVTIQTASINTNHQRRDNHLRDGDFFDAPAHPQITFRSTRVEGTPDNLRIHGNLTMRGVTRPVVLEGRFIGTTRDAQGRERMGFEAETRVNRHDFGVSWNNLAEGGGVVLGDEVTISMVVGAIRQ